MAEAKTPTTPVAAAKPAAVAMRAITVVRLGKSACHKPGEQFFAPSAAEADWLVANDAAVRIEPSAET